MSVRQFDGVTPLGLIAPSPPHDGGLASVPVRGARPVLLPGLKGAPPREIAARAKRSCTVFAVDRSGSMYGAWGDPSDICGAAAESLIDLQRRSGGGRSLIVPWGTDAPAHLVTGPLDVRRGRRELSKALRTHSSLGGNDLPAGLARVAERLPALDDDETVAVYVLTDGGESVTQATHDAVAALPPGSVHLCLIDKARMCTPDMEAAWRTVAFGSFTRFEQLDVRSIAHQMVSIYGRTLGIGS